MGRKTPKIAPSPWDFVTQMEKDQATHGHRQRAQKFGKDHSCMVPEISCQTDIQRDATDHNTSPAGEVIKTNMSANAQRDGRSAEYRWRTLFNAAKFG